MKKQDFANQVMGQSFDEDGSYGNQCWDLFRHFLNVIGAENYSCQCALTGYVPDIWALKDQYGYSDLFDYIDPSNLKDGDWVIYPKGNADAPYGHIAMLYNGGLLGQNQNGKPYVTLIGYFPGALGGLRWKGWEPDVPTYQGVDMTPVFDLGYYKTNNPDVAAEYGDNAFNHFCTYGMNEHRQASADFNVDIYKNNYKDLQDAFGDDISKYYVHYCQFGKNEGRNATSSIVETQPFAPSKSCGTATALFDNINVRTAPSTSEGLTGSQYNTSMTLNFDSVVEGDGYYWLSYVSNDGERHYCAYGSIDGSSKYWDIQ
jgi:hypothetical protein